jgi:molybdopterin-containing oxidoreductase family iron-sulfur binding subunit
MNGDTHARACDDTRNHMAASASQALDLSAIRERLSLARGREYWQSLEQAADDPAVQNMLRREFPSRASEWTDPVGRRHFLRLMGASLALAGLGACTRQPEERIVPYVRQPEQLVPGRALFFATAMAIDGHATGLLVESHTGRPTKVEGNPNHPASLGATSAFAQASILSLYDPDRAQGVTYRGTSRSWNDFITAVQGAMPLLRERGGSGLRILTGPTGSPTLGAQIRQILQALPEARWHQYSPVSRDNVRAGARLAFGQALDTRFHLGKAEVILSLDADFLDAVPDGIRHTREFAGRRRVSNGAATMNRLYVVESSPSTTGSSADHRLALRGPEIEMFARALVRLVIAGGVGSTEGFSEPVRRWLEGATGDLLQHRGSGLLMAGLAQPPVVHALVHLANQELGNNGVTVDYIDPVEVDGVDNGSSLRELAAEMDAGRVSTLVIVGANPVYSAPADLQFALRMARVPLRICMGTHADETAALSDWHVPQTHYLEEWSDTRAFDGTVSIVQPLIAPLYDAHSPHELLSVLADQPPRTGYQIVREYWQQTRSGDPAFERFWRRALHDGIVPDTAHQPRSVIVNAETVLNTPVVRAAPGIELLFRPDPTVYDGRFANNGWLQELPKPLTKLTWDDAVLISPRTAGRLGIEPRIAFRGGEHGQTLAQVVELRYDGRTLRVPAWVAPGQADECVLLHLGHGRRRAGRVGSGVGVDAYGLRTSAAPWGGGPVEVIVTDERVPLASTQAHHSMEGRNLIRTGTLEGFRDEPGFAQRGAEAPPRTLTLYPDSASAGYAWGMTIDLNACTGCNACVIACQAENNIPVVGKDEVLRGREMHWLRVDRYHTGSLDSPGTYFQPIPCMHCETAPCEVVCPVNATVHSSEGLNEMVYNRCVGTRYCSNNCPYKVRRFNFFQYADWDTPSLALLRNPDVSVRARGVMEKCTYCVQRISAAKIQSDLEGRAVRDGDIATACEAACPAQAIVFGDINDPSSRVSQLKRDPRNYGLLADLNTRPRTTYLAALRNPNPELE